MEMLQPYTEDQNQSLATRDKAKALITILKKNHAFWGSQPIQDINRKAIKEGIIKEIKPESVPEEPTALPPGFEWGVIDMNDDGQVDEMK